MRGPAEAVNQVPEFVPVDGPPKAIKELLKQIIIGLDWANGEDPLELAERWLPKFRSGLKLAINKARDESGFVRFAFNTHSPDHIQGSCFVEPRDTDKIREAKTKRANAFEYVAAFKDLSHNDFERLCGRILTLFYVEKTIVTQASADQGIDFYGRVPFGEIIKPTAIVAGAEKQLKIWLVGQAKHYSATKVGTKDIRELVGSVSLAKSKAFAGSTDPLAELKIRSCDPVFYLFFTTGKITSDAKSLLAKAGVVAMDGMQLAVFLADHGVGAEAGQFDRDSFLEWMNQ